MAVVVYILTMAFFGVIAWGMADGLVAGAMGRRFSLGRRWNVRSHRDPATFWLMMVLWMGVLAFCLFAMGMMTYGFWTGHWTKFGA